MLPVSIEIVIECENFLWKIFMEYCLDVDIFISIFIENVWLSILKIIIVYAT